ncbi:hypothetical protein DLM85_06940 [Hymenobacter edaphi]|uniref:Helicase C-terminal domain-containing protein n=2 Tax=Hymenobacter edaphi TaxID=2211146 RepID=A0A328BVR6_9BACT|nr:hypothetical protein DLM85_06940 [Hymenobacter edaphi]
MTNRFYLLGPMIKNIPVAFKEQFDLLWFPTEFATVAVDEINHETRGSLKAAEKKALKTQNLLDLLVQLQEPTLIYCSAPLKATKLCNDFVEYLNEDVYNPIELPNFDNKEIIEWIEENLNNEWLLIEALQKGIGFHHGAIPRHLGSALVDAFNQGNIKWLFCTSTLIEGVNTSAKNVVLFDKEKGRKPIDFFDYKNIAGRSGRMNNYFIGNVYRFEKPPIQTDLFIDLPLYDQKNAPIEFLFSIDTKDINNDGLAKLSEYQNHPPDILETIRKNSSINVNGQIEIINEIENNLQKYHYLLNWSSNPTYEQLLAVIDLCWHFLLKPKENRAEIRSAKHLTFMTSRYTQVKSLPILIKIIVDDPYWVKIIPDYKTRLNTLTFFTLNITRHWFDHKLPKWICVISDLQEYVFKKHGIDFGNYTLYARTLEHNFLPGNLSSLKEYDIPVSAIQKLTNILNPNDSIEELINILSILPNSMLTQFGLLPYEINKIKSAF